MRVAGGFHRGVEIHRVRVVLVALVAEQGIEVAAAAEPDFAGHQHPRVHVRRRYARIARVRDQRDAARPEFAVRLVGAWDLRREGFRKRPVDLREMHAHLFEHPAAHQAHPAAAQIFLAVAARPFGQFESPGGALVERRTGRVLKGFEPGADIGLQSLEPCAGTGFLVGERVGFRFRGHGRTLDRRAPVSQEACCHIRQGALTRVRQGG